jgi:hypothetical protein
MVVLLAQRDEQMIYLPSRHGEPKEIFAICGIATCVTSQGCLGEGEIR